MAEGVLARGGADRGPRPRRADAAAAGRSHAQQLRRSLLAWKAAGSNLRPAPSNASPQQPECASASHSSRRRRSKAIQIVGRKSAAHSANNFSARVQIGGIRFALPPYGCSADPRKLVIPDKPGLAQQGFARSGIHRAAAPWIPDSKAREPERLALFRARLASGMTEERWAHATSAQRGQTLPKLLYRGPQTYTRLCGCRLKDLQCTDR